MKTTVRTYTDWRKMASSWANGMTRFLGVYGNPGLSKTHTIRSVLGDNCELVRCHGTPIKLVESLHYASKSGRTLVLDDIDSLLKDTKTLNILKGMFDPEGTVQWHSSTAKIPEEMKEFEVRVKVAVISNDDRIFSKHLTAVEDRGIVIHLAMDAEEVHRDVGDWWPKITSDTADCPAYDSEVYDYIGGLLPIIKMPSQRAYINTATSKRDGFPWRTVVQDSFCLSSVQQFVRQLMLNPALTAEERAKKYSERFQSSRTSYFRQQGEIVTLLGIKPVLTDYELRRQTAAGPVGHIGPNTPPVRRAARQEPNRPEERTAIERVVSPPTDPNPTTPSPETVAPAPAGKGKKK